VNILTIACYSGDLKYFFKNLGETKIQEPAFDPKYGYFLYHPVNKIFYSENTKPFYVIAIFPKYFAVEIQKCDDIMKNLIF